MLTDKTVPVSFSAMVVPGHSGTIQTAKRETLKIKKSADCAIIIILL